MRIITKEWGFQEILNHPLIKRLDFNYSGVCTVYYHNNTIRSIPFSSEVFQRAYGVFPSSDGTLLFKGSWEDGVYAIRIEDGNIHWHFKTTRIKWVIPYDAYVIAIKSGASVLKLNINTGIVWDQIKSSTISRCFPLKESLLLIDAIRGRLSVIDTYSMRIIKAYSIFEVNPNNCLSCIIQKAEWKEGFIIISGLEEYPNHDFSKKKKKPFTRILSFNNTKSD